MIYLAADHRGFLRKEEIKKFLEEIAQPYIDVGNLTLDETDDEVDYVAAAAAKITPNDLGIFFCGSGAMVDIAANRFPHLRSCLGLNSKQVAAARNDDNVNVLCIASDFISLEETKTMVEIFLNTHFSGEERFLGRLEKLSEICK